MAKERLIGVHVLTRDSFDSIMEDGRLFPLEMRVDPDEAAHDCMMEVIHKWKPSIPGISMNKSSSAAYEELVDEYRTYLGTIPRWHEPKGFEPNINCMELLAGDGEFVFLSFMKPHPWIEKGYGMFVYDALDLLEKGARVTRIAHNYAKFFREWLYSDRRWNIKQAKEELLGLFQWRRDHEMTGEQAAKYLYRMADSKNAGFVSILWKGPLPVNWALTTSEGYETGDQLFSLLSHLKEEQFFAV